MELTDVDILWASDWWDGPVRGVASRNNERYWFAAVFDKSSDDYEHPRRLVLFRIADDEFEKERARHETFERLIDNTTYCYHLPREQRHGPREQRDWSRSEFYADREREAERSRAYEARPNVGWFRPPSR